MTERKTTDASYVNSIRNYCGRHPSLKLLQALPHVPDHPTRVKVLEFGTGGIRDADIGKLHELDAYWSTIRSSSTPQACKGRLYLIEDISLPYISSFGNHFNIDPRFFDEYVRFDPDRTQNFLEGYHTMRRLASLRETVKLATFVYHEIRVFHGSTPRREDYEILTSDNVKRLVTTVDHHGGPYTGLVRRNLGVWWRERVAEDDAWDAIILVDPVMSDRFTIKKWNDTNWRPVSCSNTPYLDGYLDFSAWPPSSPPYPPLSPTQTLVHASSFPSGPGLEHHHSMLADIAHYWRLASPTDLDNAFQSPTYTPLFAYRIIASHWNLQLEYLVSVVSDLEKGLLKFEQMDAHPRAEMIDAEVRGLRVLLSDVNAWRRRVYFYLEQMVWNTEVLGLPLPHISSSQERSDRKADTRALGDEKMTSAAALCATDFHQTHTHLLLTRDRIQSLLPVVMGAFSLLEAQHSVLKADLTIRLSGVALVFVPLSFTASLLSMSDEFIPGKRLFWVFFAVSVPIIVVLFWWAFWMQLGVLRRWCWRKWWETRRHQRRREGEDEEQKEE
ncbi:hypothetical protein BDV96DRAFT_114662 [Lophiotrema nucula]|uniref:Cora-like Mg2+ transporter protein-domain-containing protein n=1 Tax=Lophiotrema nucula TaxID=690887 RepID=A0A6A5Z2D1_9PLEO|nr:hypothetical protein BDV96DRAFT_114662 [Lophiotrema nucula]